MAKEFTIDITAEQFNALTDVEKEYYEQDGEGYTASSLKGLTNALKEEKAKREAFKGLNAEEAKKALELQKQIGDFDIEAAKEALAEKKANEHKQLIEKGDFDKARDAYQSEADAKIQASEARLKSIVNRFAEKELELKLRDAGVIDGLADLAVVGVLEQVAIKEIDGKIEFINKDGIGDAADLDAIIGNLKETRAALFESTRLAGSGATGANGNGASSGKWADLSNNEKVAAITTHGGRDEALKHYT